MKTTQTSSVPLSYNTTAGELNKFLATFPADARVSVNVVLGDRPWESNSYKLTVTWEKEI